MECKNEYCFFYEEVRFFCNCRLADRKGSAGYVNECRANRKFMKDNSEKDESVK